MNISVFIRGVRYVFGAHPWGVFGCFLFCVFVFSVVDCGWVRIIRLLSSISAVLIVSLVASSYSLHITFFFSRHFTYPTLLFYQINPVLLPSYADQSLWVARIFLSIWFISMFHILHPHRKHVPFLSHPPHSFLLERLFYTRFYIFRSFFSLFPSSLLCFFLSFLMFTITVLCCFSHLAVQKAQKL